MAAIQITNVEKSYQSLKALGGVSLTIDEGEFFGLLGPNGAGKTTLISILAGLNRADAGSVTVQGHDVVTDYRAARKNIGVVPQELVFDPFFKVIEDIPEDERDEIFSLEYWIFINPKLKKSINKNDKLGNLLLDDVTYENFKVIACN